MHESYFVLIRSGLSLINVADTSTLLRHLQKSSGALRPIVGEKKIYCFPLGNFFFNIQNKLHKKDLEQWGIIKGILKNLLISYVASISYIASYLTKLTLITLLKNMHICISRHFYGYGCSGINPIKPHNGST